MDQSAREMLSPPFEPPSYSISFADDGTLEWDPSIGSPELALTLSYHFPLQRTLAEKMQAATGAWLKQQQKNKVPSPDGGLNTVDGNPPLDLKPSKFKMLGLKPAVTVVMDNVTFSKLPQSLPAHKRANERAKIQTRKAVAATTSKLEVPGMASWRLEGGSFAPGRRKKRVYTDAERQEVGRNRGMVCEFHRQKKLKCDPNTCPHNKLRGEEKAVKQRTKSRISDSGSANASSPRNKTDVLDYEFLSFSTTTFETGTQRSTTHETDRSLSGTNPTSNFPSQSPESRQSRPVNSQSGKNVPSLNQHNKPSSQDGQTPETIDSSSSMATVNTTLSESQDAWSPTGFSPSFGLRNLSQFATVPEVYPQSLEELDMLIGISDMPLFGDQWPANFPAETFPVPAQVHFDMSFPQTGFDADSNWMNEFQQSSGRQINGSMDAGLDLGDLTKPFDMGLPNEGSQYDQIYNPYQDNLANFDRSSEILSKKSDSEKERQEVSLRSWSPQDAEFPSLGQPVSWSPPDSWNTPDLSSMGGMTYQVSSPMYMPGGVSHYSTRAPMNDIDDINVVPPPSASLQHLVPMGDSALSTAPFHTSISPSPVELGSGEIELQRPSQDLPLQNLTKIGSRGSRSGAPKLSFWGRLKSEVSSDAVSSQETSKTQLSQSVNYKGGALQVPAAAPRSSQSVHAGDFTSYPTSASAIRSTLSIQRTVRRDSNEQDDNQSTASSRFREPEASPRLRRKAKVLNMADGKEEDEIVLSLEQSNADANDHVAHSTPQAAPKAFVSFLGAGSQSSAHSRRSSWMPRDSESLSKSVKDRVHLAEKKTLDVESKARQEVQKTRPKPVNKPLSPLTQPTRSVPQYSKESTRPPLINESEARRRPQQAFGSASRPVSNVTTGAVDSGNVKPLRVRKFFGGSGATQESYSITSAAPSQNIDSPSNRPSDARGQSSGTYRRQSQRFTPKVQLRSELGPTSVNLQQNNDDDDDEENQSLEPGTLPDSKFNFKYFGISSLAGSGAIPFDARSEVPPATSMSRQIPLRKDSPQSIQMGRVIPRSQSKHDHTKAMSSSDKSSMTHQESQRLDEVSHLKENKMLVNDRKSRSAGAPNPGAISDAPVEKRVLRFGTIMNRSEAQVSQPHNDRGTAKDSEPSFEADCGAPWVDLKAGQKEKEEYEKMAGGGGRVERKGSTAEEGVDELNDMIGGLGLFD